MHFLYIGTGLLLKYDLVGLGASGGGLGGAVKTLFSLWYK